MKTTKLFLSIALVVLTTTSFGQFSAIKMKLFAKQTNQVEYFTADYDTNENSRIESWMHDLRSWSDNNNSRDTYEASVITRTIFIETAEIIHEEETRLESWMTTPFESGVAEEDLSMESWMVAPFESSVSEDDLTLEFWMTTPFEVTDEIDDEEWMSAAQN